MKIRFEFRKVQFFINRLVTLLAVLFLCAPMTLFKADSTVEPTATIRKTLTPIRGEEGKYELSLDITSSLGTEVQSDPLDVVLVADLSGSMSKHDVQSYNGNVISRIDALKHTLVGSNDRKGLIDTILSNPNNKLSMVGFGGKIDKKQNEQYWDGYNWRVYRNYWPDSIVYYDNISPWDDAKTILGWSNDTNTDKNAVYNLEIAGGDSIGTESGIGTGTNISAGLTLANQLIGSSRSNAKKVVIVLSDGFANMYYDNNGYTIYNYNNQDGSETAPGWFWDRLNYAIDSRASTLAPNLDGFYSIKFRYSNSIDSITSLQYYIGEHNSSIPNEIYSANNERELGEQFKEITKKIFPLGVHHVTISDVLSKYVQLLPNNSSNIRVVKEYNGQEEKLGEDKVTLETRKNESGLVEVTARFNPNYSLDDGAKYVLKFTVESTQEANDVVAGDKTVSNEEAEGGDVNKLYSNKGAQVTYSYGKDNIKSKVVTYKEKPTFKPLGPLTVPVEIEWNGVENNSVPTAQQPDKLEMKLIQKGSNGGNDKDNYRIVNATKTDVRHRNANFEKVARGYHYELNAPEVPGFTKEVTKGGTDKSPSFKVVYRQLPTLKIKKILEAENLPNKGFTINVKLTDKSRNPLNGTFGDIKVTNGQAKLILTHNSEKAFKYLPRGTHYKIEEETASTSGYDVKYQNQEGDLNTDTESIVTNHKLPSLSVTKKVTGVFANLLKSFRITIALKDKQNRPLNGTYNVSLNNKISRLQFSNGKATVELKKDHTIKIEGLPLGGRYSIEEEATSSRGYNVSYANKEGTLDEDVNVTVTNNKNSVPETGVDFFSSTLMLGVTLPIGFIFFTIILSHLVINRRK